MKSGVQNRNDAVEVSCAGQSRGRGGASGGRGRLRLRAMKGFVSHVQHALLPLDEVRRIEKATASAADLWDPRLGCLDARMLVFLLVWCQIRDEFESRFRVL